MVLCNERDRKAALPLRKFLKDQGFDVRIPVFQGDAATVREENKRRFIQCDGLILFYGDGDEGWKSTIESDLTKMKGDRADKPLLASYTYLAEPGTDDKEELIELEEPNLINGLNGFSEPEIQRFLEDVRR